MYVPKIVGTWIWYYYTQHVGTVGISYYSHRWEISILLPVICLLACHFAFCETLTLRTRWTQPDLRVRLHPRTKFEVSPMWLKIDQVPYFVLSWAESGASLSFSLGTNTDFAFTYSLLIFQAFIPIFFFFIYIYYKSNFHV